MQSIGKTELVRRIAADNTGISADVAQQVLESAMRHIGLATEAGTAVQLKGFGTFKPQHRAARMGRNPRTGEAVEVPASFRIGFTASKHRAE